MRNIEWSDVTWNPVRGCHNRCWADRAHPEGNCYAACMARRHLVADCQQCDDFLDVHFHEDRLAQPYRWRKPRWIFCGSMCDLWTDDPPKELDNWRNNIWTVMYDTPQHTYVVLTKRPERIDFAEMQYLVPSTERWNGYNLVIGVTVAHEEDVRRLRTLAEKLHDHWQRPDGLRFQPQLLACFEPLLARGPFRQSSLELQGLFDWVIVGAATGVLKRKYPPTEGVKEAMHQVGQEALRQGVPLFVKPNAATLVPGWMRDLRERPGPRGKNP